MPDLNLPPRLNGEIERLSSETRTVVIIGANGAGKSRFTRRLATGLGDRAYRLNALDALYSVKGCPLARALRDRFKRMGHFPARKFK